jgi:hypothetical protein
MVPGKKELNTLEDTKRGKDIRNYQGFQRRAIDNTGSIGA